MSECKKAQSHHELIMELKDSCLPKTEREHAAVREIERLEQRLAEIEAKLPRWIPVKERLPKPGATILAVDNSGDMGVCTFVNPKLVGECFGFEAYLNDGGWDCSPSKVNGEYVTHWMPLLEPPESGKGGVMDKEQRMYKLKNGSDTAIWAAGEIESLEELLSAYKQKLAETENGLRWVCNVYMVDDDYTGDLRKERLERAVKYAMKKGRLKEANGSEGE